jgi:preprotein translocase subunit SecD
VVQIARRRIAWLGVVLLFFTGLLTWGSATEQPGASPTPELALDLQGGTQIILTPVIGEGDQASAEQIQQAASIIRQRIDGSGVAEASVTVQGEQNIVVAIPGIPSETTLQLIKASALLEFRPVLAVAQSVPVVDTNTGDESQTTDPEPTPSDPAAPAPSNPSDLAWITSEIEAEFEALDCSTDFRELGQVDDPEVPLVTCDNDRLTKFILGPVEVRGANISDASSGTIQTSTGAATNNWAVNIEFDSIGTSAFGEVTSRLFSLAEPQNQFAIVLDGLIITAPRTQAVITNGRAQITGNFNQESATALADQLKYGALPIGFEVQSQENISATLGEDSLRSGVIAGAIGFLLVIIYMTFQYRALAVVVLGSLVLAAIAVYLAVAFLSWRQGYRLSLAGVAGLIVAIGITADSFIVYFERIRDELREGKALEIAVEAGWKRAFRTVLVSDAVSFVAAVVLYLLTSSSVRGFAFTLGLITLIDLLIFVLFTHPSVQLLARSRFFRSGSKWSGFEVAAVTGKAYVGRGQFRTASVVGSTKRKTSSREAERRQTIAERKAKAAQEGGNG